MTVRKYQFEDNEVLLYRQPSVYLLHFDTESNKLCFRNIWWDFEILDATTWETHNVAQDDTVTLFRHFFHPLFSTHLAGVVTNWGFRMWHIVCSWDLTTNFLTKGLRLMKISCVISWQFVYVTVTISEAFNSEEMSVRWFVCHFIVTVF